MRCCSSADSASRNSFRGSRDLRVNLGSVVWQLLEVSVNGPNSDWHAGFTVWRLVFS